MNKMKSILLGVLCSAFSLTLLVMPNVQGTASISPTEIVMSADNPCGDQDVKEVINGKSRIIGCWGNDGTCKTKCYKSQE